MAGTIGVRTGGDSANWPPRNWD